MHLRLHSDLSQTFVFCSEAFYYDPSDHATKLYPPGKECIYLGTVSRGYIVLTYDGLVIENIRTLDIRDVISCGNGEDGPTSNGIVSSGH
jgi:hypothetical protein